MAEELLGVGFDIHGGGSDLVFPHHENEAAQTRAARGAELTQALDAQRHDPVHRREDGQVGRQHRAAARGARRSTAARPSSCICVSGHYRQPLAFSERRSSRRDANVERASARRGRRLQPRRRRPQDLAPLRERFFDALADDFNTPRRSPRCTSGCARPTAAREASATRDLREMLGVLRPREAARRRRGRRRAEVRALAEQREQARAAARLRRAPTSCATQIAALGWEVRDGPQRLRAARRRDPLRAQPRARGAARPARASGQRGLGDRGAAREPWLRGAQRRSIASAEEIERALRLGRAPGHLRRRRAPTPTPTPSELLARREPLIVALDQVQDPQNLGSICRTAECAGAAGVVIPERRAAEVTPAVCKASAGAVEHLADRARAQPRRLPRRGARRRLLVLRRERRRTSDARRPYDAPDYAGAGVVLVLGSEGSGLRPRVAERLRRS